MICIFVVVLIESCSDVWRLDWKLFVLKMGIVEIIKGLYGNLIVFDRFGVCFNVILIYNIWLVFLRY